MRPPVGAEKLSPADPIERSKRHAQIRAMYVDQRLTSTAIARHFGASHKSVLRLLDKLGVERRRSGPVDKLTCCEDGCDRAIYRIRHAGNGSWYGRRCYLHWVVYRMRVNQEYNDKHLGKDDEAWLRRLRQQLARVRRVSREVSRSLSQGSEPETTSPGACRL